MALRFLAPRGAPLALLAVLPLPAQTTLMNFTGRLAADRLGDALCYLGDLDRDGWPDLAIAAPDDTRGGASAGAVTLISGRTGAALLTMLGAPGDRFGAALAQLPDVNADGVPDLLIGAPNNTRFGGGAVYVRSGRDGTTLDTIYGYVGGLGGACASPGDQDGDGTPDYLVTEGNRVLLFSGRTARILNVWYPASAIVSGVDLTGDGIPELVLGDRECCGPTSGNVRVYRGGSFTLLTQRLGSNSYWQFGAAVAFLHDLDGDGWDEILVGAPMARPNESQSARPGAAVVMNRAASIRFQFFGDRDQDQFGATVADGGDLDGDGYHDILVGAPNGGNAQGVRTGYVRVFSGRDGSVMTTVYGAANAYAFGASLATAGNWDRFGWDEFAVGQPGGNRVGVFSTANLPLTGSTHLLQAARTGVQSFTLRTAQAGRPYLLVGSASGVSPGLRLGSLTLPLNPDPYLELSILAPAPPFLGFTGVLDATGSASASWSMFASFPPGLAPLTLHHAFVVIGPLLTFDLVSNPVTLTITP